MELAHRQIELRVRVLERARFLHRSGTLETVLRHRKSLAQVGAETCRRVVAIANARRAATAQHAERNRHDENREHRRAGYHRKQANLSLNGEITRGSMERRKRLLAQRIGPAFPRLGGPGAHGAQSHSR